MASSQYTNTTYGINAEPVSDIAPTNLLILSSGGNKYAVDVSNIVEDLHYGGIDTLYIDGVQKSIDSVENFILLLEKYREFLQTNRDFENIDLVNQLMEKLSKKIEESTVIYKPSRDIVELFYRIACFSQYLQTIFKTESNMASKQKTPAEQELFDKYSLQIQGANSVMFMVLQLIEESFDETNLARFHNYEFIPKSYTFPKIIDWLNAYRGFDPTASCNSTNRTKFYQFYEALSRFFYPEDTVKNLDRAGCGLSRISDFDNNILEGLTDLTFETINDPVAVERFKTFCTNFRSTGTVNDRETLDELEFKKKYLKYKNKYMQLKKNIK
jgi:hypothetical protein